jgi:hypothetical protein
MAIDLRFYPDIPEGMRIFAEDQEVAGVQHRIRNVMAFAKGSNHDLLFERDPSNPHDPNAIKVIGTYKGWFVWRSVHLGYVSADMARLIAERNMFSEIRPRLRNIWWGGYTQDYIVVRFDILGPKPPREPKAAKAKSVRSRKKKQLPE